MCVVCVCVLVCAFQYFGDLSRRLALRILGKEAVIDHPM